MENIDISQIKASLLEEQRLETKLKKRPETSDDVLPLLHSLYIARMNLERANWGCSVDRNRFSLLKSSLLEEAHLEQLLDVDQAQTPGASSQIDTDLQRLLKIAKDKSTIYVTEIEANLDPTVACPLLPTRETPETIQTLLSQEKVGKPQQHTITNKNEHAIIHRKANMRQPQEAKLKHKTPVSTKDPEKEIKKTKEERRQLVRYILSSTK
jgi:hypothetical protein